MQLNPYLLFNGQCKRAFQFSAPGLAPTSIAGQLQHNATRSDIRRNYEIHLPWIL
jgi:hypothetical protein